MKEFSSLFSFSIFSANYLSLNSLSLTAAMFSFTKPSNAFCILDISWEISILNEEYDFFKPFIWHNMPNKTLSLMIEKDLSTYMSYSSKKRTFLFKLSILSFFSLFSLIGMLFSSLQWFN